MRRTVGSKSVGGANRAQIGPNPGMMAQVGGKQLEIHHRLPEEGEMFVLAGPTFVTPILFLLEEMIDSERAIIRMVRPDSADAGVSKEVVAQESVESAPQPESAANKLIGTLSELTAG